MEIDISKVIPKLGPDVAYQKLKELKSMTHMEILSRYRQLPMRTSVKQWAAECKKLEDIIKNEM